MFYDLHIDGMIVTGTVYYGTCTRVQVTIQNLEKRSIGLMTYVFTYGT